MFNTGLGDTGVSLDMLAQWIVAKAIERGPEAAVLSLEQYTASSFTPGYEILALAGVEIQQNYQVTEDITLVPFSALPLSYAKDALDPPLLHPEFLLSIGLSPNYAMKYRGQAPKAALIRPIKISPKSYPLDYSLDDQELFRLDDQLYQVCECMTLIGPSAPLSFAHWTEVDQEVPCSQLLGSGWSEPVHDVMPTHAYKYNETDLNEMGKLASQFLGLSQGTKDKLRVPLLRMNQALRRTNLADKAIDLGIALEALLLNDRSYQEQITFTFRLRGAWLLGNDLIARSRLMAIFKALYELRSAAVHSGKVSANTKVTGRGKVETRTLLDEGIRLCGDTIRKIISQQEFPDWEDLVLGA